MDNPHHFAIAKGYGSVLIVVLAALWLIGMAAHGQQPAPLLLDAPGAGAASVGAGLEAAVQSRPVLVNPAAMPLANSEPGEKVRLNLFEDAVFDVSLEAVTVRSGTRYTWSGRLTEDPSSSVTIAVHGDVVQANIHSPVHGEYQLRFVGGGVHAAHKVDTNLFKPCGVGPEHAVTPEPGSGPAPKALPDPRGAPTIVDVLVVYTPSARAVVGGKAAMEALIDLAIVESNDAYEFSLINIELDLRGTFEVAYNESSGFSPALSSLQMTGDGIMDEVHVAREAVGADMVSLIINNFESCGLAYLMTSLAGNFSGLAFSVEHYSCATGNFSFAHELGHNMGAMHDLANAGNGGIFSYSLGWHWGNSSNPGYNGDYRSVMAYAPGQRVQRFSNPGVMFAGEPTGLANVANNALTLNSSASTSAGWRNTAAWISALPTGGLTSVGDEGGPFDPSSLGFALRNWDVTSANWTASSSQGWATVSAGSGTLGVGGSTTVTVNFGAAANALGSGTHSAVITFTDTTNAKVFQYTVQLTVIGEPSETLQYLYTMDTNPGWTTSGAWQWGTPVGAGTNNPDPTSGKTGSNVYGYNLFGDYTNNLTLTPLTTTAINCSNLENVGLTFWRWLGVEDSTWDNARIRVGTTGTTWTDIWIHSGPDIAETSWSQHTFDISAIADGQSTVYVRWVMGTTDSSVTFSGWNIDDVGILGDLANFTPSNDVWVGFSYAGVEKGTNPQPYNSIAEGLTYLNPGGTLHLKTGATSETPTLRTPMTVTAEGGVVVIGQGNG